MSFCLDDGSELLYGPAKSEPGAVATGFLGDEPQTAILHETAPPSEAATRAQIHTTERTAVLPSGVADVPKGKGFDKRLLLAPLALAVMLLGGFFGYRYLGSNSKNVTSIAVMPFVNESGNPDLEYLSDGMTETLIKSLTSLPNMEVRPRSAVFRYKGRDTDLQTVGKELSVQAILNGRLVERGERLMLSLELVDVEKNKVLWTEQYERKQADVVSLQSDIARDISATLSPKLSGADEAKVTKQATSDPVAYQAYLRGRYYWNKRTGEDIQKAVEQFRLAVDRDPNYALAFVGLADCYVLLPDYASSPAAESFATAKEFAERALSIDSSLAEPHATLGLIYHHNWEWADAEREYKRGVELNPNYASLYHWYSVLLFDEGRNDEASEMITRAHELDPLSNIINQNYAQMLQKRNDHEEAINICRKMIDLDPQFPGGHFTIAWSYMKLRSYDEAIASFQKALEVGGSNSDTLSDLGFAYAAVGRRDDAIKLLKELEERYQAKKAEAQAIAAIYGALGKKDKAFEWLEKAYMDRSGTLPDFFRMTYKSEPLRDDPRFKELMRRVGLPT